MSRGLSQLAKSHQSPRSVPQQEQRELRWGHVSKLAISFHGLGSTQKPIPGVMQAVRAAKETRELKKCIVAVVLEAV